MGRIIFFVFLLFSFLYSEVRYEVSEVRGGYLVDVYVSGVSLSTVSVQNYLRDGSLVNKDFTKLHIKDLFLKDNYGAPMSYVADFDIALGSESVSLDVILLEQDTIRLSNDLYPMQTPVPYCESSRSKFFDYDKSSYSRRSIRSDIAEVKSVYVYRRQPAATIGINVTDYNGLSKEVYVIKHLRLKVNSDLVRVLRSGGSREFDKIMRGKFINLSNSRIKSESFRSREKYLILASSSYLNSSVLQEFVTYRSNQFDVELVSISDAGSSKSAVRSYVRNKMPSFLLCVGRYSDFPLHSAYGPQNETAMTFNYYGASSTSGHPNCDISVGVFLVDDESDLSNIINKTKSVEQNIKNMPKLYYGHGGNTQQMGSMPPNHCDNVLREMNQDYFSPAGYDFHIETANDGATNDASIDVQVMNEGVHFMNYNGHGAESKWVYGFGTSNVSQFNNDVYPFILSCACLTGTFSNSSCMGKNFVSSAHGPAAFIGAYEVSYMGQHVLNEGLYNAIFKQDITKYGSAFIYATNSKTLPNAISQYTSCSETERTWMAWQYHLFGDPAVETMKEVNIGQSVKVIVPNGGETVATGSPCSIEWSCSDANAKFKVELLKSGSSVEVIADNVSGTSYIWNVPDDIEEGSNYKIKVSVIGDTLSDESDNSFAIKKISASPNIVWFGDWWVAHDDYQSPNGSTAELDTLKLEKDTIAEANMTIGQSDETKDIWPWACLSANFKGDIKDLISITVTYNADKDFWFTLDQEGLAEEGASYGYKLSASSSDKTVTIETKDFAQPDWVKDANLTAPLDLTKVKEVSFTPYELYGASARIAVRNLVFTGYEPTTDIKGNINKSNSLKSAISGIRNNNLYISVPVKGNYNIKIYALNGKLLMNKPNISLDKGINSLPVNNIKLTGMAIFVIDGEQNHFVQKFMLLR